MPSVALFEARCEECDHSFVKPCLGDFTYGEFLFSTMTGSAHVYFGAIGSAIWLRLEELMMELGKPTENLVAFCAGAADPVEEQRLLSESVCPNCHSTRLTVWDGDCRGTVDLRPATFERFLALPTDQQRQWVQSFESA